MTGQGGFWTVDAGNILTALALLISFWAAHMSNAKRQQANVSDFQDVKTKVNMIYEWFCNNVVGRGELPRRGSVPQEQSARQSGDD